MFVSLFGGALFSFYGLNNTADSAGCLHGYLWRLDVQPERNISELWSSADSPWWVDFSEGEAKPKKRKEKKKKGGSVTSWMILQTAQLIKQTL